MRAVPRARDRNAGVLVVAAHFVAVLVGSVLPAAEPDTALIARVARERLEESWRWRVFGRGEDLASGDVTALYQDERDILLYAATGHGLARYDLWEWTHIENADDFASGGTIRRIAASLRVLYAAADRALWRLAPGGALQRVEEGGPYFLAATRGDLYLVDAGARRHLRLRGETIGPLDGAGSSLDLPPGPILDYEVDRQRNHWLATGAALFVRAPGRRAWREIDERDLDADLVGLRASGFLRVNPPGEVVSERPSQPRVPVGEEELWARFEDPAGERPALLARYAGDRWHVLCRAAAAAAIRAVIRDGDGVYYGTTERGGLLVSADASVWERVNEPGLGPVAVEARIADTGGILWFSIAAGGLAAFDPTSRRWERVSPRVEDGLSNILSLAETEDAEIWTGERDRVSRFRADRGHEHFDSVQEIPLRRITGLGVDNRGWVWVSSAESFRGALFFDGSTWGSLDVPGFSERTVSRIVRDRRGDLWFLPDTDPGARRHSLYRLGLSTGYELQTVDVAHGPVNDLVRKEDDGFLLATEDGLLEATLSEGRFETTRRRTEADGLRERRVRAVAEGPDGSIWACYHYAGVSRVHRGGVVHYGEEDGLPSSAVRSISIVGELIYLGTDRGLCFFDGECWHAFPVASATPLQSQVTITRPARVERSALLVGTFDQGAYVYRRQTRGRPQFTFRDFAQATGRDGQIRLRWAARDYRNETEPEDLLYRWHLEGPISRQSEFRREREVRFVDLPEGEYTFAVEVRDLDGNRNRDLLGDGRLHRFRVGPGPLVGRRLYALLGTIAGAGVLGFFLVRWRRGQRRFARLRDLYDALPDGALFLDRRGNLVELNARAAELLGLVGADRRHVVGRPVHLVAPFASDETRRAVERLGRGERFALDDLAWSDSRGTELRIALEGVPLARGRRARIAGVVLVRDRTRHLAADEFRARERRLAGLRNLSERTAAALRQVLSELEARAGKDGEGAERRREIHELAKGLSLFAGASGAAADASSRAEGLAPIFLGDLVESVLRERSGTILDGFRRGENVRIDSRAQTGGWPVRASAEAMAEVLVELFQNGVEAMPDGGTLTIRTSNVRLDDDPGLPAGSYVEVLIRDTGVGMGPVELGQALDPLYSTKARDRALGMGLSLAFGVVRAHGGDLRIESRTGKGTTVRVLLPAAREAAPEQTGEGEE